MKPSYSSDQQGFDFGSGHLLQDVCSVIDMKEFPNVEPEDVASKLRCRSEYGLKVYRKCMEIWENTLDNEIVEYLRALPNRDGLHVGTISVLLNEPVDQVESDLEDAINHAGFGLDQLEMAA